MRKILVTLVTAMLMVAGFSAGVHAASENPPARAAGDDALQNAEELRARMRAPIRPPTCNASDSGEVYGRCVDRYLTRLARQLNRAISSLNHLYNDCLKALEVTNYGIPPTEGYVYRPPAPGPDFLVTALAPTNDVATEPFTYFVVSPPSCVN